MLLRRMGKEEDGGSGFVLGSLERSRGGGGGGGEALPLSLCASLLFFCWSARTRYYANERTRATGWLGGSGEWMAGDWSWPRRNSPLGGDGCCWMLRASRQEGPGEVKRVKLQTIRGIGREHGVPQCRGTVSQLTSAHRTVSGAGMCACASGFGQGLRRPLGGEREMEERALCVDGALYCSN